MVVPDAERGGEAPREVTKLDARDGTLRLRLNDATNDERYLVVSSLGFDVFDE